MNLLQLRTALRARLGSPTVGDVPDATLDDCLNRGYGQICDRFKFFSTRKLCYLTTVIGQQKYNLPSTSLVVLSVSDLTNRQELGRKDDTWANNNQWNTVNLGKPTSYVHYRNWVQLYDVPDGEYNIQVYYKYAVTLMVDDADEPVIPTPWHEGIILLGRTWFYDDRQDLPKAEHSMNVYKMWLSDKPDEFDDELAANQDMGVSVPTKSAGLRRLDFDRAD